MKFIKYSLLLLALCGFTSMTWAQTIPNPSFETDHFVSGVGYASQNGGSITGWVISDAARIGLNLGGTNTPGLFVDNGAIPNGTNVAFIQATSTTNTLSTTITGLTVGAAYRVSFRANSRAAYPSPNTSWSLNGGAFVPFTASPAVGGANPYYGNNGAFVATNTTASLALRNGTNVVTDATVLVDNFSIAQILVVSNSNDNGAGSLRQAVLDAATIPGANATITFAPALSGATILLTNGEIILSKSLTIDASALLDGIQISGDGQSRIFEVDGGQTVTFRGLTLTGGNAAGVSSGYGGAVLVSGTLIANECTFTGNKANYGFGGGGIYIGGTVTVNNSTFTDNQANNSIGGSAICNYGTLTANNCTFYGNQSIDANGAVIYTTVTMTANNCTFFGNEGSSGSYGGGIYVYGTLNLTNSIVCSNSAPDIYRNLIFVAVHQDANSLVGGNPQLAPLGNYGGPTQTMPPLPGSPAIDAGSDAITSFLPADQRRSARKVGAHVDLGAVESGGLWVQNNLNAGANSLRDVVASSSSVTNSKTVLFTPNLSGATITLASEITLSNNVAIDATSLPGGLNLGGGNVTRIFSASGPTVSLRSLTLSGGNMIGGVGGALFNNSGASLDVTRCTFFRNTSTSDGGAIGNNGTLAMSQCTLSSNGCPAFGGAIENQGQLTLIHCTITGNTATIGGGIDNFNAALNLNDSIVAGNTASQGADINNDTATFVRIGTNLVQVIANIGTVTQSGPTPISAAPLLAPLGNYGGSTKTMPPLPGSPAINTAGAASFGSDQRGYPRPVGLAADSGAVEGIYNAAGPGKITSITKLANSSIRLSFTNLTDASFPVLATTNLTQSLSNWFLVGYASDTAAGTNLIQFIDTDAVNNPQRFYRVSSP